MQFPRIDQTTAFTFIWDGDNQRKAANWSTKDVDDRDASEHEKKKVSIQEF